MESAAAVAAPTARPTTTAMSDDFDPYYEWLGIPPDARPLNHYLLLGLDVGESDRKRISNASDQRVTYLRSLQHGKRGDVSQKLLSEIVIATGCLLNEESKAAYDATLPKSAAGRESLASTSPLSMAALTGPMAPVAAPLQEPTAPPLPAAEATVAAPPRTVDGPPPATGASAASDDDEGGVAEDDEDAEPTSPVIWIAAAIAAVALTASAVLGVGIIFGWFEKPNPQLSDAEAEAEAESDSATATGRADLPDPQSELDSVAILQEADGSLPLTPGFAQLAEGLDFGRIGNDEVIENWTDEGQTVMWPIKLVRPGVFEARLTYSTFNEDSPGSLAVILNDKPLQQLKLRGSGDENTFISETFFIAMPSFGVSRLTLRSHSVNNGQFITLKSLTLRPRSLR